MSATVRFGSLLFVLALSTGAWPSGQAIQNPPPQAPTTGTSFIAGQVVESPSGRPVSESTVTIIRVSQGPNPAGRGGPSMPGPTMVVTDSQGRFFFAALPAGTYVLRGERAGYATQRPALTVEVGEAERLLDARVRLTRHASIAGVLRDEAGDPVVGMDVTLFHRTVVNGRPGLQMFTRTKSDDRGAYRLGYLSAGDFLVCACSRDPNPFDGMLLTTLASQPLQLISVATRALSVGADVVSLDNTLRTYAPTFHPNSATVARADRVALAAGEEKTGVDISVALVRATRVSGRVVGAQTALQASSMRLVPAIDAEARVELIQIPPMLVQADGRFDFASVPPGQYRLVVIHRENPGAPAGPSGLALGFVGSRGVSSPQSTRGGGSGPAGEVLWASEPLTVGDTGISGLVVALQPTLAIRGRIEYVGAAPQPTAQMFGRSNVQLQPVVIGALSPPPGFSTVMPDATFAVMGAIPGKYIPIATFMPGFPTLKSITVAGIDITDLALEVRARDITDLVITLTDTPLASLSITTPVQPAGSTPEDAAVLVFPADRKYWTDPAAARRRFRSAVLTPKGAPPFGELPAGDYVAVLALGQDAVDWMEPTRLEVLTRRGVRVTLFDGDKKTVEVR